jgi:Zn-dependent protease with chaperone function
LFQTLLSKQEPNGVLIEPGTFPDLESLITECAQAAKADLPDAIYVFPEANAAAYSSGRSRSSEQSNNSVFIGAPLLIYLRRSDLKAILLHESGHIFLRQQLWAVRLNNKIVTTLPRLGTAHIYGQGCALVFTLIPFFIILIFNVVFTKSMLFFSRREELLVDEFAANIIGADEFRSGLIRAVTRMTALSGRAKDLPSLTSIIHAEFHCRLLSSSSVRLVGKNDDYPNWFDIARAAAFEQPVGFYERVDMAFQALQHERTSLLGSHPCLVTRVEKLRGKLTDFQLDGGNWADSLEISPETERMISTGFVREMRPFFYHTKLNMGFPPTHGLSGHSSASFTCNYAACPKFDKVELILSRREIIICGISGDESVLWKEIETVEVTAKSQTNFFLDSARAYVAVLESAPSNQRIILKRKRGDPIKLEHWHFAGNVPEVVGLIQQLWKDSR